ncbi:hypothetical protein HY772_03590 [Candidatus Woesearchaeota archaeon]|nr:hypothetical protein [Candidatus Woesearchaeota archaeon]
MTSKSLISKKAQGMSLNVVIIAVIALIVLVVLAIIFAGKVKFFGGQTQSTAVQYTGQKCQIPGVNAECSSDEADCQKKGGSFDSRQFEDCAGTGCCNF